MIDVGVSYRRIEKYLKEVKLILLTHQHGDHFNRGTISRIATKRPLMRFGCCEWLVGDLLLCGVREENIDLYEPENIYKYQDVEVSSFLIAHNVPNCGYKVHFHIENGVDRAIYATDTNSLDGVEAKGYDLYLIESNYGEDEIQERIANSIRDGRYVYEYDVQNNHLSKEKCDEFIRKNIDWNGVFIPMHQHKERDKKSDG